MLTIMVIPDQRRCIAHGVLAESAENEANHQDEDRKKARSSNVHSMFLVTGG